MDMITETINNMTQTELGALPDLISLPRQPVSVKWVLNESEVTGTAGLVALLKFTDEDVQYILQNSKPFGSQANDCIESGLYDSWIPDAAKATIETKMNGPIYEILGVTALKADLFIDTVSSPYVNGSITPLNHGYILVSLCTV